MCKFIDLTGQKFNRLTVIKRVEDFVLPCGKHSVQYLCKCDCGKELKVLGQSLKTGNTMSCGCYHHDFLVKNKIHTKHNLSKTRLYKILAGMKTRCYDKNNFKYNRYGGRGIKICDEWLNDFKKFYDWAIENGYKEGLTIDRIDNNKGYFPENCRWADDFTQANNKRNNHFLTFNGETHTIAEWSRITGIKYDTIERRINFFNWSIDKALTTETKKKQNRKMLFGSIKND